MAMLKTQVTVIGTTIEDINNALRKVALVTDRLMNENAILNRELKRLKQDVDTVSGRPIF